MKLKRFLFIFLALTFLAINLDSVNAFEIVGAGEKMPTSTGVVSAKACLHYNKVSGVPETANQCNDDMYTHFSWRYTNEYYPFCVSGVKLNSPHYASKSCVLIQENSGDLNTEEKRAAIAYTIINNKISGADDFTNYYWLEVISNEYLEYASDAAQYQASLNAQLQKPYHPEGESKYNMGTAGANDKAKNGVIAANNYAKSIASHITTLEPTSLTFELKDGDYVSNLVKVSVTKYSTGNTSLDKSSFNVAFSETTKTAFPTAKIEKNNEGFYVVIPAENISVATTSEIEVVVTGSSSYYTTRGYDCGDGYQNVAIPVVEENVKTSTASIKGTITVPTASLKLSKKDDNGNFVSGATLLLKNSDGSYENQFISTGEEFVVDDLALGKYCLYEIEAPTGYIKSEQVDCITLSSSVSTGELVIENKKNVISISKKDMSDKKEIEGAIITILDSDKKPIDLTKDIYANVTSRNELLDKKVLSWKSTQTLNIITGLPQGTYYLEETMAPEGYGKINTTFAFTINADGTVKLNDSYSNSLVVLEDGNILTLYNEIIEQIVEVPDTAGTARTLYYVLSAVLLAAGGSLVYLVSRKEEM